MTRHFPRFLVLFLLLLAPGLVGPSTSFHSSFPLAVPGLLYAEKPADLPLPTSYINDFAGVLSLSTRQDLEDLCRQLHTKANADVAVVTIKSLDDGESIEDFTARLEEKWKLGKKGQDRSAIYIISLSPHRLRIEVGYGLEGILPDAKVGRLLDQVRPQAAQGNWDAAATTGLQGLADVIAADSHVTLTPAVHQYRWQGQAQSPAYGGGQGGFSLGRIVIGALLVGLLLILVLTGNIGWAWVLLSTLMGGGGGGGGGGRDDDDRGGGGFGGMGGGSSGGGGASRDF